jgi:DNA/RNA-binding domain of Phe-tRNA-synthetase-like protein
MFEVSDDWRAAYPEAHAGLLVMRGVANPAQHPALEEQKAALEVRLRSRWSGEVQAMLASDPVLQAYQTYYRRFKKSYHVRLQLESLVVKGRSLPRVSALVDAMFMAEMEHRLLTAGHDLDTLELPIRLDVARGDEAYTLLRGEAQVVKAGDMMMVDRAGVISSILYGPDQRTQITPRTQQVAYTVYAPPGVGAETVQQQLLAIQESVQLFSPEGRIELARVFAAA